MLKNIISECSMKHIYLFECLFLVIQTLRERSSVSFWKHYWNVTLECSLIVLFKMLRLKTSVPLVMCFENIIKDQITSNGRSINVTVHNVPVLRRESESPNTIILVCLTLLT